jgi:hypothetical protein
MDEASVGDLDFVNWPAIMWEAGQPHAYIENPANEKASRDYGASHSQFVPA